MDTSPDTVCFPRPKVVVHCTVPVRQIFDQHVLQVTFDVDLRLTTGESEDVTLTVKVKFDLEIYSSSPYSSSSSSSSTIFQELRAGALCS